MILATRDLADWFKQREQGGISMVNAYKKTDQKVFHNVLWNINTFKHIYYVFQFYWQRADYIIQKNTNSK